MSNAFAVDLGAWSVKVAVASPGMRGATLLNVVLIQLTLLRNGADARPREAR